MAVRPDPGDTPLRPELLRGFDLVADGVFVVDADWRCVYLNEPAARTFGLRRDELLGRDIWTAWPPAGGREFREFREAVVRVGAGGPAELLEGYVAALGRWFECRLHPAAGGVLVIFSDVTERHTATEALRASEARLAEAERIAHFGNFRWDLATGELTWSDELYRIVGRSPETFRPSPDAFIALLVPDDREPVRAAHAAALRSRERASWTQRIRRPDGTVRVVETQAQVTLGAGGRPDALVGVAHDRTERHAAELMLRRQERQTRAIIDNIPSLIFIKDRETNRYTMANQGFARLVGCTPEEIVGRRMEDLFSAEEVAARRAGDERVYASGEPLIEETTLVIGGQPRTFLLLRFLLPADDGRPPALCGVSTDVTERRQVEAERDERDRWTAAVRDAIAERRMVVHAQPMLDLRDGAIVRHELLVRMRAAGSGDLLMPGAFLPQAERHGVVQDIDRWMMARAIELAREGRRVEVNLSSVSIGDPATTDALLALLESAGPAAANVGVEITETAAIHHLQAASAFAQGITALGCHVALDDFGTGYGSFTYLRTLPVHALKVDLSFVRDLARSEHDQRVVRSIVAIARQFGLETVAEGVETADALALLRTMGVDHAQGWHIGRPGPLAARGG